MTPGTIETTCGGGAMRDNTRLNATVASQTAFGRTVPACSGGVVACRCTDEARWVNAQNLKG